MRIFSVAFGVLCGCAHAEKCPLHISFKGVRKIKARMKIWERPWRPRLSIRAGQNIGDSVKQYEIHCRDFKEAK